MTKTSTCNVYLWPSYPPTGYTSNLNLFGHTGVYGGTPPTVCWATTVTSFNVISNTYSGSSGSSSGSSWWYWNNYDNDQNGFSCDNSGGNVLHSKITGSLVFSPNCVLNAGRVRFAFRLWNGNVEIPLTYTGSNMDYLYGVTGIAIESHSFALDLVSENFYFNPSVGYTMRTAVDIPIQTSYQSSCQVYFRAAIVTLID